MMIRFREIADKALDLLYPPGLYCICCGKITDDSRTYRLCNDCMQNIKWMGERSCSKCGKALTESNPGDTCFACRSTNHVFDRGFSCAEYGMHEKNLLYELKYGSRGDIGKTIGEIVYDRMAAEFGKEGLRSRYDVVIPVPIYINRRNIRGFNQAELIADEFCRLSSIPCDKMTLIRTKETSPMKGLGGADRKANISGAFAVRDSKLHMLQAASVLFIDDIFTTGATIDEAAYVLKKAGVSRTDFVVFASGGDTITS